MENPQPNAMFALDRKKVFHDEVLRYVKNGLTYLEAIIEYCEVHDIDPAMVAELIDRPTKANLEAEGIRLHLLPDKGIGALDV